MRAYDRLAERQAEEREAQQERRRDQVLAEFGDDSWRMADEILRLRAGLAQLAEAIDWMKKGAPFGMISPGPHWKPKSEQTNVGHRRSSARARAAY
jgi:hypothetical protein